MATPYKPVLFGINDPVDKDKLNQVVNNVQYVYENMPRIQYNTYGIKKATSVKLLAGISSVKPSQSLWATNQIDFGSYFTAGCKPVIVTGTQPTTGRLRYHVVIKGLGGSYYPDHRGAVICVGADYYGTSSKNVVDTTVYVHYLVIGW